MTSSELTASSSARARPSSAWVSSALISSCITRAVAVLRSSCSRDRSASAASSCTNEDLCVCVCMCMCACVRVCVCVCVCVCVHALDHRKKRCIYIPAHPHSLFPTFATYPLGLDLALKVGHRRLKAGDRSLETRDGLRRLLEFPVQRVRLGVRRRHHHVALRQLAVEVRRPVAQLSKRKKRNGRKQSRQNSINGLFGMRLLCKTGEEHLRGVMRCWWLWREKKSLGSHP